MYRPINKSIKIIYFRIYYITTVYDFCIFTTVSYAVGIFVDTTSNYQLKKSSNLQTMSFYAIGTTSSFNNFSIVIHYFQKFCNRCETKWRKREREKKKKKPREQKLRKGREQEKEEKEEGDLNM